MFEFYRVRESIGCLVWSNIPSLFQLKKLLKAYFAKRKVFCNPVLLQENAEHLQADVTSEAWRHYLEYIDDAVIDGLYNAIQRSLSYLVVNTGKKQNQCM